MYTDCSSWRFPCRSKGVHLMVMWQQRADKPPRIINIAVLCRMLEGCVTSIAYRERKVA
jgi:hypothetical protein